MLATHIEVFPAMANFGAHHQSGTWPGLNIAPRDVDNGRTPLDQRTGPAVSSPCSGANLCPRRVLCVSPSPVVGHNPLRRSVMMMIRPLDRCIWIPWSAVSVEEKEEGRVDALTVREKPQLSRRKVKRQWWYMYLPDGRSRGLHKHKIKSELHSFQSMRNTDLIPPDTFGHDLSVQYQEPESCECSEINTQKDPSRKRADGQPERRSHKWEGSRR